MRFSSPSAVETALLDEGYLADHGLAVAIFLAQAMSRPLFLEGEPGVGKTEVARSLAGTLGAELVRLQCHEGIDAAQALYEWDYQRQLLAVQGAAGVDSVYSEGYLIERPLLRALRTGDQSVLLIDEIDRADDEFEAFLLEFLSDFAVTIPELGTITAETPPLVVITSNRTRDVHDALKRRCLYHWIEYPDLRRQTEIIRRRAPEIPDRLADAVARAVAELRDLGLAKPPGVAEAIDWAVALRILGAETVDADRVRATIGVVLKDHRDQRRAEGVELHGTAD